MARIPISFYLNVLAGALVLFNHFAASETGDVALNKVTGAAGRFYALFRDTTLTLQHGCVSRLETALCGPTLDGVLPHDVAEYLRVRYCPAFPLDSHSDTSERVYEQHQQSHCCRGYGGTDAAFVAYGPMPVRLRSPARSPFVGLGWSSQNQLCRAVWDWAGRVIVTVGLLLLRTCAAWWWFRAPISATGVLLAAYAALSTAESVFGGSVVVRCISQVYVASAMDFLQCIEWEARRLALDMGVVAMERVVCGIAEHARTRRV